MFARQPRLAAGAAALLVAALVAAAALPSARARLVHNDQAPWSAAEGVSLGAAYPLGEKKGAMWVLHQQSRVMLARADYQARGVAAAKLPGMVKKVWAANHMRTGSDAICAVVDYRPGPDKLRDHPELEEFEVVGAKDFWLRQSAADHTWEWSADPRKTKRKSWRSLSRLEVSPGVPAPGPVLSLAAELLDNQERWEGRAPNPYGLPPALRAALAPRGVPSPQKGEATHVAKPEAAGAPLYFKREHGTSGPWLWSASSGGAGGLKLQLNPTPEPEAKWTRASAGGAGAPAGFGPLLAQLAALPDRPAAAAAAGHARDTVWCGGLREDAEAGGAKANAYTLQPLVRPGMPSPFTRHDQLMVTSSFESVTLIATLLARDTRTGAIRSFSVGQDGVAPSAGGNAGGLVAALRKAGFNPAAAELQLRFGRLRPGDPGDSMAAYDAGSGRLALLRVIAGGAWSTWHTGRLPPGCRVSAATLGRSFNEVLVVQGPPSALGGKWLRALDPSKPAKGGLGGFGDAEGVRLPEPKGPDSVAFFARLPQPKAGGTPAEHDSLFEARPSKDQYVVHRNAEVRVGDFEWLYTQKRLDPLADPDNDGLPTGFELGFREGAPLHRYGASPFVQDVFVHLVYMKEGWRSRLISKEGRRLAVAAMASRGINLHMFVDRDVPFERCLGGVRDKYTLKRFRKDYFNKYMPAARKDLFLFGLYGYQYNCPGTSGGNAFFIGSNQFIVTTGGYSARDQKDPIVEAQILLHEIGHTLGLKHGSVDNHNKKPNHISIMNYDYQRGVRVDGGRELLYSELTCESLDEAKLDENKGVRCQAPRGSRRRYQFHLAMFQRHAYANGWRDLNKPVDFNNNGKIDGALPPNEWVDLNENRNRKDKLKGGVNEYAKMKPNYLARFTRLADPKKHSLRDWERVTAAYGAEAQATIENAVMGRAADLLAEKDPAPENDLDPRDLAKVPAELRRSEPESVPREVNEPAGPHGELQVLPTTWAAASYQARVAGVPGADLEVGANDDNEWLVDKDEPGLVRLRRPIVPDLDEHPYGSHPMLAMPPDVLANNLGRSGLQRLNPGMLDGAQEQRVRVA